MAEKKRRLYIVCYDIREPKRLSRVHRYLSRRGVAMQYSVFLVYTHSVGLSRILDGLNGIIEPRRDDVRAYPLPPNLDYVHRGRVLFPDGIDLHGASLPAELAGLARTQTLSELATFI